MYGRELIGVCQRCQRPAFTHIFQVAPNGVWFGCLKCHNYARIDHIENLVDVIEQIRECWAEMDQKEPAQVWLNSRFEIIPR